MDKIKVTSNKDNTSIEELEYAIVSKIYVDAEESLTLLIRQSVENKIELVVAPFDRTLTKEQKELESYQVIEKLAVLITMWFSDKSYKPSDNTYAFICLQKMFLGNVFSASSYHSTDHILTNLGLMGKTEYTPVELQKLLFVITNESSLEIPWDVMFKHLPEHSILAYSGLSRSINIQMSQRAQKSIQNLVKAACIAPTAICSNPANLSPLLSTYFNCSNLADPDKYEIKKWIVRCIVRFMNDYLTPGLKKRIKNEVKTKPIIDKPTILVFHEFYTNSHAMYRGHHPRIAALREKFYVVGMGIDTQFDEIGQSDFDQVIVIAEANKLDLNSMIKAILKLSPDIILYPSVGMSIFVPLIASLRLAPIQIASGGHPSSTYLDTIDYFHFIDMGQGLDVMEDILHEKWLPTKRLGLQRKEGPFSTIDLGIDEQIPNVMVNGVIQKVSINVIEACKDISLKTSPTPHFHFFMTHPKQDIEYFAAKSILRRYLPNSSLHPFSSYSNYMSVLKCCKFAIATFPFGGTNSNIDLVRLNKPKLFIKDNNDLSGLADYDIWSTLGYLNGLCGSVAELIERSVSWLNHEDELNEAITDIKNSELQKRFTQNGADKSQIDTPLRDKLIELIENFREARDE
jgi:hypothetical protein